MKREQLEGKSFGKLTVIKYIGSGRYKCVCECGKITEAFAENLKRGHTTSCGCSKIVNLTGQTFGNLLVLQRGESKLRGEKKRTIWICKCLLCGKIVEVYYDALTNGNTASCGCLTMRKGMPEALKKTFVDGTQTSKLVAQPTKANKSGVVGVNWDKSRGKWQASIRFKGKKYNLGRFDDFELAVEARKKAEEEIHGEFLKHHEMITGKEQN